MLDPRPLHVWIEVLHVDEPGSPPVGAVGDRTRELELTVVGSDGDDLPRLDVRAECDGEVGQAGKERIPTHRRESMQQPAA